jgi:hypothetical protein
LSPAKITPEELEVMRNDPETAGAAKLMPEIPELLPENCGSYDLWDLVKDQVRVGFKGPFALDLGTVDRIMDRFGFDDEVGELIKMKALFREKYLSKENK